VLNSGAPRQKKRNPVNVKGLAGNLSKPMPFGTLIEDIVTRLSLSRLGGASEDENIMFAGGRFGARDVWTGRSGKTATTRGLGSGGGQKWRHKTYDFARPRWAANSRRGEET